MKKANSTQKSFYRAAKVILPSIFGAACVYYIITAFEWTEIWRTLREVDVWLFLASSVSATLVFWFLRTVRWKILLKDENLRIPFFRLYLYTAITVGFANFTPFQSFEAYKVELFRKYGGERFSGYNYFFLEKLFDLAVISTLALFSVFVLFEFGGGNRLQLAIAGLTAALIVSAAAIVLILKKQAGRGRLVAPKLTNLAAAFVITLLSWTAMIFGWHFIFQSAAINLSFAQTASVVSLTTVISILSFVPGAVGVSEISIAAMLSQIGYEKVAAQTGAMLIAVYSLVILILSVIHLVILKKIKTADNKTF